MNEYKVSGEISVESFCGAMTGESHTDLQHNHIPCEALPDVGGLCKACLGEEAPRAAYSSSPSRAPLYALTRSNLGEYFPAGVQS